METPIIIVLVVFGFIASIHAQKTSWLKTAPGVWILKVGKDLYLTLAQYHFEGIPPFRAMQLVEALTLRSETEEGDLDSSKNPYGSYSTKEIKYQYMMGESILVAPMFAGELNREVLLPPGKWYDFYTGKLVGEEEVITITPGLDNISLFVKDGAIIPMLKEDRTRMPVQGEILPLEIRHYGQKEAALFNISTLRTQTCFRLTDGALYAWEGCNDKRKRSPFNKAECSHHYGRAMASWSAVMALIGFHYSGIQKEITFNDINGNYFWSNGYAYGTVDLEELETGKQIKLNVLSGSLQLSNIVIENLGEFSIPEVVTLKAGETDSYVIN